MTVPHPISFDDALRLHQQGRLEEAEAAYQEILAAAPNHAGGLHLLGVIRQQQGRHAESCELIGRAIEADPAKAVYRNNYGAALLSLDRREEAEASFRRALAIRPRYADAWANLGMAETALRKEAAALESLQKALYFDPRHRDALRRLAALLKKLGRAGEAVAFYERAVAQRSTADMYFEFGELLFGLGQRDRAIEQYRRAIMAADRTPGPGGKSEILNPKSETNSKSEIQDSKQEPHPGNRTLQAPWQGAPLAEAHFSLANALKDEGKIEEAAAHYRRAMELKPDSPMMHGNLLLCEQYRADVTPAGLAAAHAEWDRRHAAPLRAAWRPFKNDRSAHRPLRLGFVSCNFRQHPVGLFAVRVIEALKNMPSPPAAEGNPKSQIRNPIQISNLKFEIQNNSPSPPAPLPEGEGSRACEVVCYSDVSRPDAITERFRAAADRWVDTGELSDEQLAEQIRNDQIDILFDLGGHLGGNRLLVFAQAGAHPGEMGRLSGERWADGHGLPAGRSMAGRGRRRSILSGKGAAAPRWLCVFRPARGCAGGWGVAGAGSRDGREIRNSKSEIRNKSQI